MREAFSQRHLATKSAYTSKFYLEQPKYASPTPSPQIALLWGSTASRAENFQVGNRQKTVTSSGKAAVGRRAGSRLPCVLSWDTATTRGSTRDADAAERLSPELRNACLARGSSRAPDVADVGPVGTKWSPPLLGRGEMHPTSQPPKVTWRPHPQCGPSQHGVRHTVGTCYPTCQ